MFEQKIMLTNNLRYVKDEVIGLAREPAIQGFVAAPLSYLRSEVRIGGPQTPGLRHRNEERP